MSNMADACQSLSPEAIRANRGQILKAFEFGRREPLAQDGQVIFLIPGQQSQSARFCMRSD